MIVQQTDIFNENETEQRKLLDINQCVKHDFSDVVWFVYEMKTEHTGHKMKKTSWKKNAVTMITGFEIIHLIGVKLSLIHISSRHL